MKQKGNMTGQREHLGSRLGFIMLSAGCAVGCGNVWKFPWVCGTNGGGGFVLIYIFFLLLLGLPALTMEFTVGRAAQTSPVRMFQKLQKPGGKWGAMVIFAIVGNVALMAFYTVVAGWMIYYFICFLTGRYGELSFGSMISNPGVNVTFLAVTVILVFAVLSFGLQNGLERIAKYIMIALLILMLVMMARNLTLSGAREGLAFYLVPDFSEIDGSAIVNAMNQAFFTLSLGVGGMAIFGSYIGKERSLMGEAGWVIFLDTAVALMSGIIIFPACFTYDLEVTSGPGLLFDTMASVFRNMEGGRWWGTLFFLFMVFAAMSTVLAVCEVILAMAREMFGWSRKKGSLICGCGIFLLSLTTALGFSVLHFQPFEEGTTFLNFWDFIVSTCLIAPGALLTSLFCCYRFGWGWDKFILEANTGKGLKVRPWMKPVFRYVLPVIITFVYVYGLATFKWK